MAPPAATRQEHRFDPWAALTAEADAAARRRRIPASALSNCTRRQRVAYVLSCDGWSLHRLASATGLSRPTVRQHVRAAAKKVTKPTAAPLTDRQLDRLERALARREWELIELRQVMRGDELLPRPPLPARHPLPVWVDTAKLAATYCQADAPRCAIRPRCDGCRATAKG